MVLTVLAISTMRTASLELLMAGNAQYRENAFRLAQSGIDAVVRGGEPGGAGDCPAPWPIRRWKWPNWAGATSRGLLPRRVHHARQQLSAHSHLQL